MKDRQCHSPLEAIYCSLRRKEDGRERDAKRENLSFADKSRDFHDPVTDDLWPVDNVFYLVPADEL